jgi:hypothetical protein
VTLGALFVIFRALETGLEFDDFSEGTLEGPRLRLHTPVVVEMLVRGSLNSNHQFANLQKAKSK